MGTIDINAARCEALFVSCQPAGDDIGADAVRDAIRRTVREFGIRGCAARVAQDFGDYPEMAVARMCWARRVVARTFGVRSRTAPLALCPDMTGPEQQAA